MKKLATLGLAACAFLLVGCHFELDTSRNTPERGSLGTEIYEILKNDFDRMQPKKGLAFEREQARFIRAFDTLMPDEMLDDIQLYLVAILPLYDEGILAAAVRPMACILSDLAASPEFLQALWYSDHPAGYGRDTHSPVLRRILQNPITPDLLEHLGQLWLAHDGFDADLIVSAEDDTFTALLRELSKKMKKATVEPVDQECSAAVAIDFILSTDSRLLAGQGDEHWIVKTDLRGRALSARDSNSGALVEPFVDQDLDGLADIDPLSGDFIDAASALLDVPPPFLPDGSRAQRQGEYIYQYSDLRQSMLGALTDQLHPLIEDGFLWELPDALPVLLGEIVARADADGTFPGYEPDDSPIVALTHALLVLLDYDRLPELLDVLLTVTEMREPQLACVLHEIDLVSDIADNYQDVNLADKNRLLDDLLPHLLESAERGYLEGFLRAFSDPRSIGLQPGLADMIRYSDHLDDEVAGGMQFSILTDFNASDSLYTNRSNLQKMMHLTHDTNGSVHTTNIAGFDIFTIPDMLVFWLDSAADTAQPDEGLAEVPWYVVAAVLEFESGNPSVEEVNRFMNHDHGILGNPEGHEGHELLNYNAESLLALEASGMLEALKPGITANAIKDRGLARSGTKVFAELLSAIHPHYSVNVPFASNACANMRLLEPMLLDIFDNTEVVTRTIELLGSLDGLQTVSGLNVIEELDRFTLHMLSYDGTILRHNGDNWVYAVDETTQVSPISPVYLLLDATRLVDQAVEGDPAADAALERTAELLGDRFLDVEEVEGVWRFKNHRAWYLFLNAISFFKERMTKYRDLGTLSQELTDLEDDVRDLVGGRVTPRAVTAFELIADDPNLPNELDSLVLDLLDPSDSDWVRVIRKNMAWLLQGLLVDRVMVPVANTLGPQIDPDGHGWGFAKGIGCISLDPPHPLVSRTMDLVLRMAQTQVPNRDVFAELITNFGDLAAGPDGFPLHDFGQVLGSIHRDDPEQTAEKSAADYGTILQEVSDYLLDDVSGLEKLYEQVCRRKGECF